MGRSWYADETYLKVRGRWVYLYRAIDRDGKKLPEAKKGFVWLPRRWVVERSFAWVARFRRLARDYKRLPETLAGLHFLAFAILMLKRFVTLMLQSA